MQSALRQASRRAASAAGRRGVATEAERERVALLVQQEVRAQMRAARDAEALAFLRARAEAAVVAAIYLKEGVKMGFAFLGGAYATMFYALYRAFA